MNPLVHLFISILFLTIFKLNLSEVLSISIASLLIDIDHIIYYLYNIKKLKLNHILSKCKREYKLHTPHLYFFHTLEFVLLGLAIFYFINWYIFLVFYCFLIHILVDLASDSLYHKSILKLLPYYSIISYYLKK